MNFLEATFLLTILCCGVRSQNIVPLVEIDDPILTLNALSPVKIPEEILIRMKDVRNLSDFMNIFSIPEENHFSRESTIAHSAPVGKRPLLAPGPVAPFALCQPDPQVVTLENSDPVVFLWPPCVRVKRCNGCCTSGRLSCVATANSSRNFTVLRLRYNPLRPDTFDTEGTETHTIEEHEHCTCACAQTESDCTVGVQLYREEECRCKCKELPCTGANRIWDDGNCSCRCRRIRQCSSGREFSPVTCRCEEKKRDLSAFSNSSLS